ncbi:hypothetical protein IVA88_27915 [Bradyrhizobium sp. 149]|uniref:hypothetical protein n=1 Tax=Bradyrhizobium sp. 149 TaxID=2782624 RepID=UPI001FF8BC10|nr:hypothetical protein [Bradyrhizobium sp. 149]MCK1655242.1 hypothetical protein [Bradyrhizobium sp. 149]
MTAKELQAIAAGIFERITDLELELAPRDLIKVEELRGRTKMTKRGTDSIYDLLRRTVEGVRQNLVRSYP